MLEFLYNGIEYEDIVILLLYHSLCKTEANGLTWWRPKTPSWSSDTMNMVLLNAQKEHHESNES